MSIDRFGGTEVDENSLIGWIEGNLEQMTDKAIEMSLKVRSNPPFVLIFSVLMAMVDQRLNGFRHLQELIRGVLVLEHNMKVMQDRVSKGVPKSDRENVMSLNEYYRSMFRDLLESVN